MWIKWVLESSDFKNVVLINRGSLCETTVFIIVILTIIKNVLKSKQFLCVYHCCLFLLHLAVTEVKVGM